MASRGSQIVDSTQPIGKLHPGRGPAPESVFHLLQCRSVDSGRQVAGVDEPRKRHELQYTQSSLSSPFRSGVFRLSSSDQHKVSTSRGQAASKRLVPGAFNFKRRNRFNWCRGRDSNPHEGLPQGILSPPRLPFRHPGRAALPRRFCHTGGREDTLSERSPFRRTRASFRRHR